MAKAMSVPVLVLENKQDVKILCRALNLSKEKGIDNERLTEELLNEIYKIERILENTNNS
tara:strand:- start:2207 stop:2386 length:180 start_codon:yes stop_codon:yes gene_type:complete